MKIWGHLVVVPARCRFTGDERRRGREEDLRAFYKLGNLGFLDVGGCLDYETNMGIWSFY